MAGRAEKFWGNSCFLILLTDRCRISPQDVQNGNPGLGFASGYTGQYFAALARRRAIGCIFGAGRKRHSGPQFLNKGVFMKLTLRDAIACFLFLLIVTAAKGQAATVIYAATQNGPYKSADGGLTWKPITVNPGNSFLQGVPNLGAIAVDPQNPSTVYFAGAFGSTSGFCKSTDAAQSWSCVTPTC